MKHYKLILALLISTALIFSCNPKNNNPTHPVEPPAGAVKKAITEVLTANEIASLTANINSTAAKGKPVKITTTVTVAPASTITLTDNGGGSFSIDYGGATNLVYMFFRGGDSLSTVSGNVYPTASLQYDVSITSWAATFSRANYQSLVVTGSLERDANGIIGADWVFTYTNVVQ